MAEIHDWLVVDLRVDWYEAPIAELRRLWELYAPQRAAHVQRARALAGAEFLGGSPASGRTADP